MPENQASWTSLTNAIKGIELGHIREGVRKYKERAAETEKFQAQITLLEQCTASNAVLLNSPTKPIRNHLSRTTISQPATIRTNPFSGNNGSQGNLFSTPPCHFTPITQAKPIQQHTTGDEVKMIQNSITLYPMQPLTEEGLAAYCEQINTWHQRNGNAKPTRDTGFPLCPGGAQPGLNKCYKCGMTGHLGRACISKNMLRRFKSNFQVICSSILTAAQHPPAQVNFVAANTIKFSWADGMAPNQQQGNGEGLSAY